MRKIYRYEHPTLGLISSYDSQMPYKKAFFQGETVMDVESLQQIIGMHIKECDSRDARNVKTSERIEILVKGIWDSIDKTNERITAMQIRAAYAIGGICAFDIIVQTALQYFQLLHK